MKAAHPASQRSPGFELCCSVVAALTSGSSVSDVATAALDDVLATYFDWERQDYQGSVEAIRRGYDDVKAGRTRLAAEFLEELREKHGFPR